MQPRPPSPALRLPPTASQSLFMYRHHSTTHTQFRIPYKLQGPTATQPHPLRPQELMPRNAGLSPAQGRGMGVALTLAAPEADATSQEIPNQGAHRAQQRAPPCCKSMTWKGDGARGLLGGSHGSSCAPEAPSPASPASCPIQPSLDSPASLAPGSPSCPGARKGEPAEGASLRPAQLPAQELAAVPTLLAHPNPKYSVTRGGTSSCTLASGHRCGYTPQIL